VFSEVGAGTVRALLDKVGIKEKTRWTVEGVLSVEIQESPDWSGGWPDAVVEELTGAFWSYAASFRLRKWHSIAAADPVIGALSADRYRDTRTSEHDSEWPLATK
jgi:hypothetical protein